MLGYLIGKVFDSTTTDTIRCGYCGREHHVWPKEFKKRIKKYAPFTRRYGELAIHQWISACEECQSDLEPGLGWLNKEKKLNPDL